LGTIFSIAVASAVIGVAAPAVVYYEEMPATDPFAEKLRTYGFITINPPSTLVEVGSLYYVSTDVSDFREICTAEPTDLQDVVKKSRSLQIEEDLSQEGGFASKVSVDFGSLIKADVANKYVQKVHYSLTDVELEEIPLGSNLLISTKLMKIANCNAAVLEQLKAGGYVCQGQKILRATAEFKLDRTARNEIKTDVDVAPEKVNDVLKAAIKTQSDQNVVEREGRLFSGSALNYGVAVNPTCLTPSDAHFARILPTTAWGRMVNFVLYRFVERLLPAA
jgi:hypothetical protein